MANACALMEYLTRHFPNVLVLALTIISNPLSLTRLQEICGKPVRSSAERFTHLLLKEHKIVR